MLINNLPKLINKRKKRLGQGIGTGKGGHTSSRGMKGQKSRGRIYPLFEGTKTKKSLIQRLPLLRGKGKFKSLQEKAIFIKVSDLEKIPQSEPINAQTLIKYGILTKKVANRRIKILGDAKATKPFKISLPISKSASIQIQKAGGIVNYQDLN